MSKLYEKYFSTFSTIFLFCLLISNVITLKSQNQLKNTLNSKKLLKTNSLGTCPFLKDPITQIGKEYFLGKKYQVCDEMKLKEPGRGSIKFKAKGNDWYLRLFKNKGDYQHFAYFIIFSGWSNTMTELKRWPSDIVCKAKSTIDSNTIQDYEVTFDKMRNLIEIYMNSNKVFSCVDKKGFQDPEAQYYGFSCYCEVPSSRNIFIYQVDQTQLLEREEENC